MKKIELNSYWEDTVSKVTSAWNWISGKTYKQALKEKKELEDKIKGFEIDLEALKIKLASTEIDLKASEIEKETIKMQLEEKKMQLVDLRLKLNQIESNTLTSDIEFNQLVRRLKLKEEESENMKDKMLAIMNMLAIMSENEKYRDIVKIQTNTIEENGKESHTIYITYNGQTVDIKTSEFEEQEQSIEQEQPRQEANQKIISFNPNKLFEEENDLAEIAE